MSHAATVSRHIKITVISDYVTLQEIKSEWIALAKNSAPDNFFATWEFAISWWESYGADAELFVLSCRREGELIGIAPLYRTFTPAPGGQRLRSLRLIGDGSDDADGFQFLIGDATDRECLDTILRFLSEHSGEWDLLELNSIPEELTSELRAALDEHGWIKRLQWAPHFVVELPCSWEDYLQLLRSKVRKNLLRDLRRANEKLELNLRHCQREEDVEPFLKAAFALHQANWQARGREGKLLLESRRCFYAALCEQAFAVGNLDLWLLEAAGQPCAALVGFRSGNYRFELLPGRDARFAGYSLGTVIHALIIKESLEADVSRYDFLSGEDRYKKRLGATARRYLNLSVARRNTPAGMWLAAKNSSSASKQWLRTKMPSVFAVLKKVAGKQ